jgi:general secretion pathway protein N
MRIRLPLGRSLFLVAAFLFALLALLPLRLAIDRMGFDARGLSARTATGTIWFGALQEARIGPAALGDVEARLNLFPLFLGRARLSVAGSGEGGIEGAIVATRHGFAVDGVSGRFRFGPLFAPLPLTALDLDAFGVGFAAGRCIHAEGRVRATVTLDVGGAVVAPTLAGQARCAGDALLLPLAGSTGMEQLELRIFADGRYRLHLLVRTADAGLRARLAMAGFRPAGNALGLQVDGRF